MPTVLRVEAYRFFFFSQKGNEPAHVHVEAAGKRAKYWLRPIALSWNEGFRSGELKLVERLLLQHVDSLLEAWDDYFRI